MPFAAALKGSYLRRQAGTIPNCAAALRRSLDVVRRHAAGMLAPLGGLLLTPGRPGRECVDAVEGPPASIFVFLRRERPEPKAAQEPTKPGHRSSRAHAGWARSPRPRVPGGPDRRGSARAAGS